MRKYLLILMCGMFLSGVLPTRGEANVIAKGSNVTFDYTLTVEGEIVDSSEKSQPLEYVHGEGMIIPGLETALEGLKEQDSKKVTVAAKDAYGLRDEKLVTEVPRSKLSPDIEPQVGMMLQLQTAQGQPLAGTITIVRDETVTLDFNHPLAGKELIFDVTIVTVK